MPRHIVFLLILAMPPFASGDSGRNFWSEMGVLRQRITERYTQPKGNPKAVGPYVQWLGPKGEDRDQAEAIFQELEALVKADPDNQDLRDFLLEADSIARFAQDSGDQTTLRAMSFMKIQGRGWENALMNMQELRPL